MLRLSSSHLRFKMEIVGQPQSATVRCGQKYTCRVTAKTDE
jgi:hypothetical protein